MTSKESIAYLKGLIEGSELELNKKEEKVADATLDVLSTLAEEIVDTNERIDDMVGVIDEIHDTIEMISHTIVQLIDMNRGEDDEDAYDDEEEDPIFEIECPSCGESIVIDDESWEDGSVVCYECGTVIELEDSDEFFEVDDDDDDDDDED